MAISEPSRAITSSAKDAAQSSNCSEELSMGKRSSISSDAKVPALPVSLEVKEAKEAGYQEDSAIEYPRGIRLALIILGLALAVFLVFLDMTLIATAIPAITNQFNSLQHVGWYGSAYMLSLCSFQLVYGKCYELFSLKLTFMVAIAFREVGLAVCGSAPNSIAFIIGRAITGIGCSGIIIGTWVVLAHSVPIRQRAVYTGFLGAFSGVGGIIGPLISGALTDSHLSWRWAFYISIPVGIATLGLIQFSFKPPAQIISGGNRKLSSQIKEFDIIGLAVFFACMVSLLLALQWGGSEYPWSSGPMIALLVLFTVMLVAFVTSQIWKGDKAALPPRLMKQRNVAFACLYAACIDAAYYTADIWLPIWFQAIKGNSARESGIKLVPYVGGEVLAALVAGYLVTLLGWYNPFMLFSTTISSVGLGLMTRFEVDTGPSEWIIYPIIAGIGIGAGTQQPMMGVQSTLVLADIPAGTAAVTLFQNLGPAVLMSVANTVFVNNLKRNLHGQGGLDGQAIADMGATNLKDMISVDLLPGIINAYNKALQETFRVPMAVAVISIIGVLGMKWEKLPA
ncbi:Efflux pump roqT [Colletotrichum fructicola]|nr:Efflux pump [Colletotrichum fructicola]KAE9567014.1 Efflux pump [Colletotrichum fructicola]KAF4420892.1 Efflux pump roqT [Colletotrichum fructicola]KAF4884317.1 Efflux pump roqT [Colletotrichum fructicola]KAF4907880.1 Efflux pump roqT [Colletotrichum fructicola]KAF4938485.1 Efflux pump roqT [Colletotrichum fructicola]